MQKVEGSSPFIRFKSPANRRFSTNRWRRAGDFDHAEGPEFDPCCEVACLPRTSRKSPFWPARPQHGEQAFSRAVDTWWTKPRKSNHARWAATPVAMLIEPADRLARVMNPNYIPVRRNRPLRALDTATSPSRSSRTTTTGA